MLRDRELRDVRKPGNHGHVLLIGLLFFLLSLLFTYPIWTRPASMLNEVRDTALNTWILAWDAHAILNKPLELFNANIFFPQQRTLAFSENLLGSAIPVAPLNWWGEPVLAYNVVLFASFVLSGMATALWVRVISGSLFGGLVAGFIWAFAPVKFDHLAHLQLLTGQWIPFTLLAIALYFDSGQRRYAVAAGGLFGLQYLSGIYLGLMFLPFVLIYTGLLLVHHRAAGQVVAGRRLVGDAAVAVVVAAVLVVPISLPYMWVNEAEGFERGLRDVGGAQLQAYVSPSLLNKAPHMRLLAAAYYRSESNFFPGVLPWLLFIAGAVVLLPALVGQRWPGAAAVRVDATVGPRKGRELWVLRASIAASVLFGLLHVAGFLVAGWAGRPPVVEPLIALCQTIHPSLWLGVAATLAMWLWLRSRRALPTRAAHYAILGLMLLISYLLAFGPGVVGSGTDLGVGPFRVLHELVQPYRSMRAVGRFGLFWMLFFAAMVGFSVAAVRQLARTRLAAVGWRRVRVAAVALLAATLLFEYRVWPLPAVGVSPSESEVDVWLAEQPKHTSIVHTPLAPGGDVIRGNVRYMLGSTLHFLPLVNGYSGFVPSSWLALLRTRDLGDEFLDTLRRRFPVDYLIVHGSEYGDDFDRVLSRQLLADRRRLSLVKRLGDVLVFEVRRDLDSGLDMSRRFTGSQLRAASGVVFQARVAATSTARRPVLKVAWGGAPPEDLELGLDWRRFEVPVPEAGAFDPDGTATLSLNSGYVLDASVPGPEIGSSGRHLGVDLLIDAQGIGVLLAINDAWRDAMNNFGIQVYNLGRRGDRIRYQAMFPADGFQQGELIAFLDSVPETDVVALGIRYPEGLRVSPPVAAALRRLGASLRAGETVRRYALIGAPGLTPGTAAEHVGHGRADVLVGEAGHRRQVSLRHIRLIGRKPRE